MRDQLLSPRTGAAPRLLALTSLGTQRPAPAIPPPVCTSGSLPVPHDSLELSGSRFRAECFCAKIKQRKMGAARGGLSASLAVSPGRKGTGPAGVRGPRVWANTTRGGPPTPPRGTPGLACFSSRASPPIPFWVLDRLVKRDHASLEQPPPLPTSGPWDFLFPPLGTTPGVPSRLSWGHSLYLPAPPFSHS